MRKLSVIVGVAMLATLASIAPAGATIDQIVEVGAGTQYTWDGTPTPGSNINYFGLASVGGNRIPPDTPATPANVCTKDRNAYCDVLLFKITNPISDDEAAQGITSKTASATIRIDWASPVPEAPDLALATDFDILGFASDEFGTKGQELGASTNFTPDNGPTEQFSTTVTTTVAQPSAYVLLHVVYWAVPNPGGYAGTITVS